MAAAQTDNVRGALVEASTGLAARADAAEPRVRPVSEIAA